MGSNYTHKLICTNTYISHINTIRTQRSFYTDKNTDRNTLTHMETNQALHFPVIHSVFAADSDYVNKILSSPRSLFFDLSGEPSDMRHVREWLLARKGM